MVLVTKDINGIDPIDVNDLNDVSIKDATPTQKGAVLLSTDSDTIAGIGTRCVTPTNLKAKLGDQTANLVAVAKGNAQSFDYWSFYSSDSSIIVDTDSANKRYNFKTNSSRALFKAYYSANTGLVIPAGTDYVLLPNTIAYDLTSSWNAATGTFTAPFTRKYQFVLSIGLASLGVATGRLQLFASTSTETYVIEDRNIGSLLFSGGYRSSGTTDGISLNQGQTIQFKINIAGLLTSAAIAGGALTARPSSISGWSL